jgi:hypothetical protein
MRVVSEYRPSPIAGLWYQSDPQQLTLEIEDYLSTAQPPEINGKIVGLVVPHAGHRYSGATALMPIGPYLTSPLIRSSFSLRCINTICSR